MTVSSRTFLHAMVLAMAMALPLALSMPRTAAAQAAADAAETTIKEWYAALVDGDTDAIESLLAPEFMLARADGSWATADGFTDDLPSLTEIPDITDMVVTTHGDYIVARYKVTATTMLRGNPIEVLAPRLTVLRRGDEGWLLAADADFATPPPPE